MRLTIYSLCLGHSWPYVPLSVGSNSNVLLTFSSLEYIYLICASWVFGWNPQFLHEQLGVRE